MCSSRNVILKVLGLTWCSEDKNLVQKRKWHQKKQGYHQKIHQSFLIPSCSFNFCQEIIEPCHFSRVYLLISTNSLISKSIFGGFILVLCPLKEMTNLKLIILCKYAVSVKYLKNHKQIITLSECIILCTQRTVVERS